MLTLPISLASTGAAALINIWLTQRIGQIRRREKISLGDGGNPALIARMRAQLNFAEFTPVALILIALIELAQGSALWLAAVATLFILARIIHPLGMDGMRYGRPVATWITVLTLAGLGLDAIWLGISSL